jgi:hypothetical protein
MRIKILSLIVIFSFFLTAFTQVSVSNLAISHMEIDIWPEYDQQSVLVIFHLSFSSITDFPALVSLRIPVSAGKPYSVTMKDLDGMSYDLEYTVIPDGNWNRIEFITSSKELQIEFYEPYYFMQSLTIRGYDFSWISDYPIDDLKVSIQQPKLSSSMTIDPNAGSGVLNPADGLTYYSLNFGKIDQGSAVNIKIAYTKNGNGLSASTVSVNPASPLPGPRSVWQTLKSVFPSIWGNQSLMVTTSLLLGALLLFALLLIVFRVPDANHEKRIRPETTRLKAQAANKEEKEIYCYQCGKRARPGDAYCRVCGSRLVE